MSRYAIVKVHDGTYSPTPQPVDLPPMKPGDSVRVTLRDDGGFDVVPLVESEERPGHWVAPEQEKPCMSRGPRIGYEGSPYCKRPDGHEGPHRPDPSDGWEPGMEWGDPK